MAVRIPDALDPLLVPIGDVRPDPANYNQHSAAQVWSRNGRPSDQAQRRDAGDFDGHLLIGMEWNYSGWQGTG